MQRRGNNICQSTIRWENLLTAEAAVIFVLLWLLLHIHRCKWNRTIPSIAVQLPFWKWPTIMTMTTKREKCQWGQGNCYIYFRKLMNTGETRYFLKTHGKPLISFLAQYLSKSYITFVGGKWSDQVSITNPSSYRLNMSLRWVTQQTKVQRKMDKNCH